MNYISLFCAILIMVTQECFATQEPIKKQLKFTHLHEGISQKTISVIFQDKEGFIWFGTRYGLNKYDGKEFYTYLHDGDNPSSISSNTIRDALVDSLGNFWIACGTSGVDYFDYKTHTFTNFKNNPNNQHSLSGNHTSSILLDRKNQLWVGTEGNGLNLYHEDIHQFERFYHQKNNPRSLSSNNVRDLVEDHNGHIWIATLGGGLNLFDEKSNTFKRYNSQNSALKNDLIFSLAKGKTGIWVGTEKGLYQIKNSKSNQHIVQEIECIDQTALKNLQEYTIFSIFEDPEEKLWIGTENGGLYVYDTITKTLQQFTSATKSGDTLVSNSIWSIFVDQANTLWVGTYNNGVNVYDAYQRKFRHVYHQKGIENTLSHNFVNTFEQDAEGNLWIGTDGGGLNYLNEKTGDYTYFKYDKNRETSITSNVILDLLIDQKSQLWVATWQGGLCRKLKDKDAFIHYPFHTISDNHIYFLFEDTKGKIWVSLFREGVAILDPETGDFKILKPDLSHDLSISSSKNRIIFQDTQGAIWLGSEELGIDRIVVDADYNIIEKQNFSHSSENKNSISHDLITSIFEDVKGNIWIGTFGGGINIFNPKKQSFDYINTADGLTSDLIFSIQSDLNGEIWVSTSAGLNLIKTDGSIETFDTKDGLQDDEFVKSASFLTANGELLFGGINGFNRFFPEEIQRNKKSPKVFLTKFSLSNKDSIGHANGQLLKDIYPSNRIELAHDENDFEFGFSVLNYSQPSKNQYAYMLYPYDHDWIHINPNDRIYYTNVPPGEYEFRVKGANNDGVWNEKGDRISLFIAKPWWQTYIAYSIYFCFFASIFYSMSRMMINRERLKSKFEREHFEVEHLHEMDQLKSRFFTNISHEFRTPLTLIIDPIKLLLDGSFQGNPFKLYQMMLRNAEKLLNLVNELLELSKIESGNLQLAVSENDLVKFLKPIAYSFTGYADRKNIDYKCEFEEEALTVFFEREKIEKVVTNLLSNAFKYTNTYGHISLSVSKQGQFAKIVVKDTGLGIAEEHKQYVFDRFYQVNEKKYEGTGIGLALVKELVELHQGQISVESEEGKGSTFTILLKLGTAHLSEEQIYHAPKIEEQEYSYQESKETDSDHEPIVDKLSQHTPAKNKPKLLLAEDNEDLRLFIRSFLSPNYRLLEAENGQEALKLTKHYNPDLILTDIMMPVMNGYELAKTIKADDKTSHIPIIMLTAKANQGDEIEGLEIGADDYITKPFTPKALELRIKNMLKLKLVIREKLLENNMGDLSPKLVQVASRDKEFLSNILQIVEDNIANSEFTVDELCKSIGLSRTQLYRKLKGLVGQSANEFIRSIRMKRAAQLLSQQQMTIAEITYQVGFNDLQYFRDCFKKQYGVNPSEYANIK